MTAPLSIVIPTLNAAPQLAACLQGLVEGASEGLVAELIISDGGSDDDVAELTELVGGTFISGPRSRGGQLARGAEAARGQWILFLHADSHLPANWPEALQDAMAEGTDRAWYFRLSFRSKGLGGAFVSGWANLRSRLFGLPYGDQGLLIPAALYEKVGGHKDLPLMEDVAIARALRGRLAMLPMTLSTSAERYEREGWIRRGARNLWTLSRYLLGADPQKLALRYSRTD
ncbi:TIGR04283 family arsenosugar biosynthesis glycosyltransferase [Alphaproteobacteria bacterium KMM 3653]|uniref:TIGR04283 family arsenosugar biosynthesis glycosyltransferase n=1 Tax=Harenicola maris TaxID=2841044 RepID=A0AAP2CSG4_9RHOB|nr:TIGR04283 family arsenosugar biosynthesis glycosyltransferase [Harenicola maris]